MTKWYCYALEYINRCIVFVYGNLTHSDDTDVISHAMLGVQ